jgi:hypothetical protein
MTTIRRIRVEEAHAVRDLYARMVADAAAKHPEDRIAISERGLHNFETYFRLGAVHQDVITLVAERDGELVGFVLAEISRSGAMPCVAGEINELWTSGPEDEALRGELAREAIDALRERGAGPIFHLEDAAHTERTPWEPLGFEADVVRFSLYPEDGVGA